MNYRLLKVQICILEMVVTVSAIVLRTGLELMIWLDGIMLSNDIIDDISACEDASTPIDIEDLLDNICSLSEADFNSRTKRIQGHVDNLNQKLSEIEATDEWKFLLDPDNDPFKQECIISGRLITKVYKTAQERDDLLVGYSENMSNENWNDDYIFPDGDEGFLDSSARRSLIYIKYVHNKVANGIKANQRNLIKLGIAKSSFFSIPVRSLPPSVGLSPEISDSHIARGVENTLGSIRDSLAETFDCTFGMSCSNDIDNAAKNPNIGQELTTEERDAFAGNVCGTPNGWEPDDESSKQQEVQTANRESEIRRLFEYGNSRSGIQIGNRTLIEMPNKGNAKIFSGASEAEVQQYFIELTGNKSLPEARVVPGKGNIYTVRTPNGNFNLRDFSYSVKDTGKAWTIDIPRGIAKDTARVEIKFLK